tara:strand:+ start:1301 stop:1510 length:210 start_codon:yes stop_codon:yes gene_type:complete
MTSKKIFHHLPFILFSYFFLGVIIGGLFATQERIDLLECSFITKGWHISVVAALLYLPLFFIYLKKSKN